MVSPVRITITLTLSFMLNQTSGMKIASSIPYCLSNTISCCNNTAEVYFENKKIELACGNETTVPPSSVPLLVMSCTSCIIRSVDFQLSNFSTEVFVPILIITPVLVFASFVLLSAVGYSKLRLREKKDSRKNKYVFSMIGVAEYRGSSVYKYSWWGLIVYLCCAGRNAHSCSIPEYADQQLTVFTLTPSMKICEQHGVHHLSDYNYVYPLVELYETSGWDKYSWIKKDCGNSEMCSNSEGCAYFGSLGRFRNHNGVEGAYKKFCVSRANNFQGFNCYFRSWWCWVYTLEPLFSKYPRFKVYRMSTPVVDYKMASSGTVDLIPSVVGLPQEPLGKGVIAMNMVTGTLWYCEEFSFSGRPFKNQLGDLQFINGTMSFIWESIKVDDDSWDSNGQSDWPTSFIHSHLESSCEQLSKDYVMRPSSLGGQLRFNGSPILGRVMMIGDKTKLTTYNISNTCYNLVTELHGAKKESSHFTVLIKADSFNSSSTMVISSPCFIGTHSINCDGRYNYFLASDVSKECMYNGTVIDRSTDYRPFIDERTGGWIHHSDWTYYGLNGILGSSMVMYVVVIILVVLLLRRR